MKEFKLKPCPFCSGKTELYVRFGEVFIACYKCHAHISFTDCETEIVQTVKKYEMRTEEKDDEKLN